jgi:hypothetical protein
MVRAAEIDGAGSAMSGAAEYFRTRSKKGRGRAKRSLDLIAAMYAIAEVCQPITGRGVGYKLFIQKLVASMSIRGMNPVYRLLKEAREEGIIPWEWIVDETRELEKVSTWRDPAAFVRTVSKSYRRDFWNRQPVRVQVWSEKGTVRGVLAPVLNEYGVGFMPVHGFSSATAVNDIAQDDDGRPLFILYVGDLDPSGMWMSEEDLPNRFEKYGGDHVVIKRIALTRADCVGLPSFPAADKGPKPGKKGDTRYPWFVRNYGHECWELDAMDPNDLRVRVEAAIHEHIEWEHGGETTRLTAPNRNRCGRFWTAGARRDGRPRHRRR